MLGKPSKVAMLPNVFEAYSAISGVDQCVTGPIWHEPSSFIPCRVGSVGSVSASRTVGREFASRPGHTKDHHKNGTYCLPA